MYIVPRRFARAVDPRLLELADVVPVDLGKRGSSVGGRSRRDRTVQSTSVSAGGESGGGVQAYKNRIRAGKTTPLGCGACVSPLVCVDRKEKTRCRAKLARAIARRPRSAEAILLQRLPLFTALLWCPRRVGRNAAQAKPTPAPSGWVSRSKPRNSTARPNAKLITRHFGMVVSEYQMKANVSRPPGKGEYGLVGGGRHRPRSPRPNGMRVRGHALVWHQSTPDWFLEGGDPAVVRTRLETYIHDVVSRYRGRVFAWDVVNEAVSDGEGTPIATTGGTGRPARTYLDWAFHAARRADPDCLLFLNDYGTERRAKLDRLLDVVADLIDRGVPVDGVGHQFHLARGQPIAGIHDALDAVADAGLVSHITELDVSVYNDPGSCYDDGKGCQPALADDDVAGFLAEQAHLYRVVFTAARDRPSVRAVLTWGLHDGQSWLNGFPVKRSNHPLLFDRSLEPKPALHALLGGDPATTRGAAAPE